MLALFVVVTLSKGDYIFQSNIYFFGLPGIVMQSLSCIFINEKNLFALWQLIDI